MSDCKDFRRINSPRVEKLMEMVRIIEKSARSHKAEEEYRRIIAPLLEALPGGDAAAVAPRPVDRPTPSRGLPQTALEMTRWVSCLSPPLFRALTAAVAVRAVEDLQEMEVKVSDVLD